MADSIVGWTCDAEAEALIQKRVLEYRARFEVVDALHVGIIRRDACVLQSSTLLQCGRSVGEYICAGVVVDVVLA